MRIGPQQQTRL